MSEDNELVLLDIYDNIQKYDNHDYIEKWMSSITNFDTNYMCINHKLLCYINNNNILKLIKFLHKFNPSVIHQYIYLLTPYANNYIEDLIYLAYESDSVHIYRCIESLIPHVTLDKDIYLLVNLAGRTDNLYIEDCVSLMVNYINNIEPLINLSKQSPCYNIYRCIESLIHKANKDNILSLINLSKLSSNSNIYRCIEVLIRKADKDHILSLIELAHKSNNDNIYRCIEVLIRSNDEGNKFNHQCNNVIVPSNSNIKSLINLINDKLSNPKDIIMLRKSILLISNYLMNDDDIEYFLKSKFLHGIFFGFNDIDNEYIYYQLITKTKNIKLFVKHKTIITFNILSCLRSKGLDLDTINTENIKIILSDEEKILMSLIMKETFRSTSDPIPNFKYKIDYYTYMIHVGFLDYNKKDIFNQLIGYPNIPNSNLYYPLMLQEILENNLKVSFDDIENLKIHMDIKREENNFLKEEHDREIKNKLI